ncbi:MAG: 2-C-methyl-D-erythritol 2,4-cyclodiphosphate synthase [Desulfobacteraceae bacterium]|jgi:2-C-methyl-D-erythritol 2,4-cyclodiphosphate synthase|nr:2-C-methyl-D-erythritol 2,4-cyclodiphosphate synthase [Desulfobacteraceae bacterium]
MTTRIGMGYDIHRLVPGRRLVIGGETIPFEKGLLGHSDADVLVHAACDAILGAVGMGDIGDWFPDTDPRYLNMYSIDLLTTVYRRVSTSGFKLVNMDATVFAQAPRITPYKDRMATRMADCMSVDKRMINIKATTTEGLGAIGRGDGIAAMCVVLLHAATPEAGSSRAARNDG